MITFLFLSFCQPLFCLSPDATRIWLLKTDSGVTWRASTKPSAKTLCVQRVATDSCEKNIWPNIWKRTSLITKCCPPIRPPSQPARACLLDDTLSGIAGSAWKRLSRILWALIWKVVKSVDDQDIPRIPLALIGTKRLSLITQHALRCALDTYLPTLDTHSSDIIQVSTVEMKL